MTDENSSKKPVALADLDEQTTEEMFALGAQQIGKMSEALVTMPKFLWDLLKQRNTHYVNQLPSEHQAAGRYTIHCLLKFEELANWIRDNEPDKQQAQKALEAFQAIKQQETKPNDEEG